MNQEDLLQIARRRPFQPFRVHITSGDKYDIVHPDLIMVGKRSATIGITNEASGSPIYDYAFWVDLLHIVGVEELPPLPKASNGNNGQSNGDG